MPDQFTATDPVFTVAGQRVPDLARDCLRLEIEESTEGLRSLAAHFVASAPRARPVDDVVEYLGGDPLDFGVDVSVSLGPPGDERVLFAGTISAIEAGFEMGDTPHVSIYAEDALMKLRMTRRSATYTEVTDADLARRIASRHGLSGAADADGPSYPVVQQANESDLSFLRARAALIGAELWAAGTTLHFTTRDRRTGPAITLAQGRELLAVTVRADLAHQRTEVRVSGFDARRRDRLDARADGAVVLAEVSGGRTGPQVLSRAMGERPEQRARLAPTGQGAASAWARSQMLFRARRFVTVVGTATGVPQVVVGARLTLDRVGRPFDGPGYYVTRARQVYQRGGGGLRTHFEAERPTLNTAGGAR